MKRCLFYLLFLFSHKIPNLCHKTISPNSTIRYKKHSSGAHPLQNQLGVVAEAVGKQRDGQAVEPNLPGVPSKHAVKLQRHNGLVRVDHPCPELPPKTQNRTEEESRASVDLVCVCVCV